jgi:protein disulfide-isomerase-like protein
MANLLKSFVFLVAAVVPSGASVHLTKDNFEEKTNGKKVFIKYYAPWCGHCKELAPKWDKMAKEWEKQDQVLVASVDCTKEEEWCVSLGIQGFPTLLFGDPSQGGVFLEPYSGDKEYEALSEFAKETLNQPICSPGNPSVCDEPVRKKIVNMWGLSDSDLEKQILQQQQLIEEAENEFQQKFEEMQAAYDKEEMGNEFQLAKMRSKIRLLKRFLSKK